MSFKNAFKILISKFGLVWVVLLYLIAYAVLFGGISFLVLLPIVRAFRAAGIGEQWAGVFDSIMNGESVDGWFEQGYQIVNACLAVVKTEFAGSQGWLIVAAVSVGLLARFLIGLYELPLVAVLEGAMSSNARIGFMGQFISKLGRSCVFVLTKMLFTVTFDAIMLTVVYYMLYMFTVDGLSVFAPFIIMIVVIALLAFRFTLLSMWAPGIIVGNKRVFPALFGGVKKTFHNFGSIYSTFIMTWTLLIALNILVGLFTFGAGLFVTVPVTLTFTAILNMTIYYNKSGKRYYVDATVVTPPTARDL